MPKPVIKTTGGAAPCIICGEQVWAGESNNLTRELENHYLANHTNKPARHPLDKPKKRVVQKPEPMFDRDAYLTKKH